jgi:hypothetical protein
MKRNLFDLLQVDAHNIVPVRVASPKLEVAARTIRTKINSQLPTFLTEFPKVSSQLPIISIVEELLKQGMSCWIWLIRSRVGLGKRVRNRRQTR